MPTNRLLTVVALTLTWLTLIDVAEGAQPQVIQGLANPESAAVGPDGRVYVSEIGGFNEDGDGRILVIDGAGKIGGFADGLDDPKGLDTWRDWLVVADKMQLVRVDMDGRQELLAEAEDFPRQPRFLNDIEVDREGNVYVSDSGDLKGSGGAIYRLDAQGQVTEVQLDEPRLGSPNGLLMDGPDHMLVVDLASGNLFRLDLHSGRAMKLSGGYGGGDGLARDSRGRVYVSDYGGGRVFVLDDVQASPRELAGDFEAAADIAIAPDGRHLLVPDMKAGKVVFLPLPD